MRIRKFMTTLNYASCNEDWRSEWDALKITSDDRILCVTGSGDRPLDLLYQNPKSVIAMDLNPVQNHLLGLKMASMQKLDYDEYASFLGLNNGGDRLKSWCKVREILPQEGREFWDKQTNVLAKGVIYQGRWESHLRTLALIARLIRGGVISELFKFEDLNKQKKFVEMKWAKWWWRLTFEVLGSKTFSRIFFGDPGFYRYITEDMNIGKYIFDRMKAYLENNLARESFMLSLMFRSKLSEYDLPPYLSRSGFYKIADKLDRIDIRTGNILEFMESEKKQSITKFSLSDVPSFIDQEGFERLLNGIVRSGSPGARFCIRQFLTNHVVPERFERTLVREPELEEHLGKSDRSFAYRFVVGTLKPGCQV